MSERALCPRCGGVAQPIYPANSETPTNYICGTCHDDIDVEDVIHEHENAQFVERTDVGYSLEVSLTRGSGTRDQDKIKGKVKGSSREECSEEIDALKDDLRDLATYSRAVQPTDDAEADDE